MISYQSTHRLADAILAKGMLDGLEQYYPEFGHWYVNKCMPGVVSGKDTMLVAREHGQIIGVALGKKDDKETKLRCVRVLPAYQKRGVGIHLIERMLRQLDNDKPLCTVSEEMLHDYSRAFINYFHFDLSSVARGAYRDGKLEYVFNDEDNATGKLILSQSAYPQETQPEQNAVFQSNCGKMSLNNFPRVILLR